MFTLTPFGTMYQFSLTSYIIHAESTKTKVTKKLTWQR